LEGADKRNFIDRRKEPTPALSRYTFLGRRRSFRRKADRQIGGYVDCYSSTLFLFLVSIIGLNVLDAFLTMLILEVGGCEVNPFVRSVMDLYGEKFWVWKYALVSFSILLLCLHSKFKRVKAIIVGISYVYFIVVLYQVYLMAHR
jgi:hypothetical protein